MMCHIKLISAEYTLTIFFKTSIGVGIFLERMRKLFETGEYEELHYYGRKLKYIDNPSKQILAHEDEKFDNEWCECNKPNDYITITEYDCRD